MIVTSGGLVVVPAPVLNCQALTLGNLGFTWSAVTGATGYDFVFAPAGHHHVRPAITSTTRTGLLGTGTATVKTRIDYGSTTGISQPSNTRSYTIILGVANTCG